MTPQQAVDRALGVVGKLTVYALGKGNSNPDDSTPGAECDCSGLVSWVLGSPRHLKNALYERWNGGWFETTAVHRDAKSPFGFFAEVKYYEARPGDVLVWGDHAGKQGHIGLVTECDEHGPTKVVHCSKGNWRRSGDAVQETSPEVFISNFAVAARWHEFSEPEGGVV